MKRRLKFATLALMLLSLNIPSIQSAQAGCRDYPDSVTPECVAQNLAEAAVLQEAYAAEQTARQLAAEQAAKANAERDAQDRAATAAADAGLAADDCARSTNRYLQSCLDAQTAKAAAENLAKDLADRAATAVADAGLAADDCARSTNRFLQSCIDAQIAKAVAENLAKDLADRTATAEKDAGLAADDCARSTNRFLQSCIDAQTARAAAENAAKNVAEQDAALEVAKIRPTLDANGNVALNALLKSSSLGAQDIANVLATSNLSDSDKTLLTGYAQKLNAVKTTQRKKSFKLPLSDSLTEDFESTTPGICKVVDGIVKNLKPGTCKITLKFTTESGYEVQVVKKIVIKK